LRRPPHAPTAQAAPRGRGGWGPLARPRRVPPQRGGPALSCGSRRAPPTAVIMPPRGKHVRRAPPTSKKKEEKRKPRIIQCVACPKRIAENNLKRVPKNLKKAHYWEYVCPFTKNPLVDDGDDTIGELVRIASRKGLMMCRACLIEKDPGNKLTVQCSRCKLWATEREADDKEWEGEGPDVPPKIRCARRSAVDRQA